MKLISGKLYLAWKKVKTALENLRHINSDAVILKILKQIIFFGAIHKISYDYCCS